MKLDYTFRLAAPDISAWRQGNTSNEGVWQFDSGKPGRHVLITALIHGNEICGAWALKGLLEANVKPEQGKLTLAFCNLAAFDKFDSLNHDASRFLDQDMNRQWIPERIAAGDTLERRRVAQLAPFVEQADWLLDIHSMHDPGPPLLLTGIQARNRRLAKELANPEYIVVDAGHKDGVRMRDFGRFGLETPEAANTRSLLIECGFHGDPASADVARDACFRFLQASEVISAASLASQLPGWRQADAKEQWALEVTGPVVAKSSQFSFARPVRALERIASQGTVIADNEGEAVTTPYDDCVLVMPSTRQVATGVTVVRYARRHPL